MLKKTFLELRKKIPNPKLKLLDKFQNQKISLVATVQYLDLLPKVKEKLQKNNQILIKKGAYYPSHVLGCNASAIDPKADIILLLADGKFHAANLAKIVKREITIFTGKKIEKYTKEELQKELKEIEKKKRKFLLSKKIGIIISNKPGQYFKNTASLTKKLSNIGKKVYLFETDTLDLNEFENFRDIQMWINTSCPGIEQDHPRIINLQNILEFINNHR